MSDIILGHPPDPTGFTPGGAGPSTVVWPLSVFTTELLDALGAVGLWIENLTQVASAQVLTVTRGTKDLTITFRQPAGKAWELDDGYALQRQSDLWHFSTQTAVDECRDPNDWTFGWTAQLVWGVIQAPFDKSPEGVNLYLSKIGALQAAMADPTRPISYDVQVNTVTGELVSARMTNDPNRPWGTGDRLPPLSISTQLLLPDAAAQVVAISIDGGGTGRKASPHGTATAGA